jgi:hypothetical protein
MKGVDIDEHSTLFTPSFGAFVSDFGEGYGKVAVAQFFEAPALPPVGTRGNEPELFPVGTTRVLAPFEC